MAINRLALAEMQEAEESRNSFSVTDKASADWCLRKIAAYRSEMAENEKLVQTEIERLQQWLKAENEKAEQSIGYFSGLLEAWLRSEYERDERKRSISLPHGRIRLRKQQSEYTYRDEELLPFLKTTAPELVRTQVIEKYDKTELKTFIKTNCHVTEEGVPVLAATGEVLPGVQITDRPPKFEVETEGI